MVATSCGSVPNERSAITSTAGSPQMSASGAKSTLKPRLCRYVPMVCATSSAAAGSPAAPTSAMSPTFSMAKPGLPAMRVTVPPSSSTQVNSGKPTASSEYACTLANMVAVWSGSSRFFWK